MEDTDSEQVEEIYSINEKNIIDTIDLDFDISDYNIENNKTKPILTKYEKTTVMIMRCEQINSGSLPLIKDYDKYNNIEDIVEEELNQKLIPFIIKRNIINHTDYWKLYEMEIY